MNWLLLVPGILLVVAAALDALWTTLWVEGGAGPIARRVLMYTRRGLRTIFRNRRHPRLSLAGPLSITVTLGIWVLMTWAGWSLIYLSGDNAIVSGQDGSQAGTIDHVYFVAYTIFTVGYGDFVPNGGIWKLLAGIASINGLGLVTLALTYVITVLTAVVQQRALANQILGMAEQPQDFVLNAWNRGRFEGLDEILGSLSSMLSGTAERRLAYPILHAYHSANRQKSVSIAIAVLDEALTILRFGVRSDARPAAMPLVSARAAVGSYFETLPPQDVREAEEGPPPPSLEPLRAAGIPMVDDETFREAVDALAERRRLLLGNLKMDDWEWPAATDGAFNQTD